MLLNQRVKGRIEQRFFHQDIEHDIFLTQASQALPLYWGLVPEEKAPDVAEAFRFTLTEKGAFVSGEVGLPYIIQMAAKYGMNDLIAKFILREEHPSYYAFVLDGETTLGEYWEKNPRSHCHDMMGHIIHWYYSGIAGIRPLKPGFAEILICPYLPESIHEITCSYQSVRGKISVHVKESDDEIVLSAAVPNGVAYSVDVRNLNRDGKEAAVHVSIGKHL